MSRHVLVLCLLAFMGLSGAACLNPRAASEAAQNRLVLDLRKALGDKWIISVETNVLTIASEKELSMACIPGGRLYSQDEIDKLATMRTYQVQYKIGPLVTQERYDDLYKAQLAKQKELGEERKALIRSGIEEGGKGELSPKNDAERMKVQEWEERCWKWPTLPVYWYDDLSIYYRPEEDFVMYESSYVPANEEARRVMPLLQDVFETVVHKYTTPGH